ncbi:MAG: hypothetical protein P4K93_15050 [Terracidiphilus sp.]|nr:hypothetical protein [Terracidiphilus sp.]
MIRLLLAIVFGVFLGQYVERDYEKWHALGRDAFLSEQGRRFDTYMAHPTAGVLHIIVATMLVVGLVALYEMAAFFAEKWWPHDAGGSSSTTPNS